MNDLWFHAAHGLHDEAHHQHHRPLDLCVPLWSRHDCSLDTAALDEIDKAASTAHDYIAPLPGTEPSQAEANKAIWRIHEIVRPALERLMREGSAET